jgi:hypothetical protein
MPQAEAVDRLRKAKRRAIQVLEKPHSLGLGLARIARDVQSHGESSGAGWYQAAYGLRDSRRSTGGFARKWLKAQHLPWGILRVRFPPPPQ